MTTTQEKLHQAALWSMLLSAAAVVVSIAVCQILLGLALVTLIASDTPLRFPPVKAPLGVFMGLTVVSMLASGHPAAGLPQIRKFFVFTILLAVSSLLLEARHARWLAGAWALAATVSALLSLVQFVRKVELARDRHQDFYEFYVRERITGFLSHWMTFSEVGMLVLLVLVSYLFFAPGLSARIKVLGWLSAGVLVTSLMVSFTRSIWLATAASGGYLVWQRRRKLLLVAPVALALALVASPGVVKKRVRSMFSARSDSSTSARMIMWRTGWRMIQARPRFQPPDVGELPPAFYGHLHNLYIHYAAERGIPAVLAMLWLLGRVLRDHWRALRRALEDENRFALHAVVAATIGVLLGAMFEVNLGDSEVLTVFLTLVSLGYAAISRTEARKLA
ncbi:MAG: O-antigen ligase family protein [Acidobacteria bacterium]|nr:O-antigen ligase family protein [Acidobacteriota bacterium]